MGTINRSTTMDVRELGISIANVLPLFSSQTISKGKTMEMDVADKMSERIA